MSRPTVLHVDLDAFFAAVEQRDRPELRGRPVIVGGGGPTDRGVVSTCSYEARVFGVRSAMPLRTAAALCPEAVFLPVDGGRYLEVSRQVMEILRRFTPVVEQVSIDEAFLEVGGSEALFGPARVIGGLIRSAISDEVGITASVGVAANRLVAKVASDLCKPDGLLVVTPGSEASFLAPLPLERLWGVGPQTRRALQDYGATTIGDVAALPRDLLVRRFGSVGSVMGDRARGIDATGFGQGVDAKSISHEHTFAVDTGDWETIEATLLGLGDDVGSRLREASLLARTIGVKIRDRHFRTFTRQRALPAPTDDGRKIGRVAARLARPETRGVEVRLLGVAATQLSGVAQLELFGAPDSDRRVLDAEDAIRRRFGRRAITRARLLADPVPEPFERDAKGLRDP
ncbi:MAG: DNA polymerase IV [Chloroflexi bacterium]|nr:DNA polymerase IV [Chloroflexota bacterium]HEV8054027.1 DNA polymerase IV [Candidatus Limnocylindrales bacterium]